MKVQEEYYCTNYQELQYLMNQDLRYSFVKKILDSNKEITVWKFKKTKELYKLLNDYYNQNL
jgi:hypothetical protein